MCKKIRILSLSLALSLTAAQVSFAEVTKAPESGMEVLYGEVGSRVGPGASDEKNTQSSTFDQSSNNNSVSTVGPGGQTDTTLNPGAGNPGGSQSPSAGSTNQTTTNQTPANQTNQVPAKQTTVPEPKISAEAAVLYDATHNTFLFEKNADMKLYPASMTKLMTALLVLENAKLDDMVTFSKTAVTNLESGAVTLKVSEGDKISVKDCLYGLLLKSANEVANGLAEHVGGSISGFADMMNAKASALGCTGTHFVNPSGLNDNNHYTTCRDMAKITKAAFDNKTLCEMASTLSYQFPATKNAGAQTLTAGHKMLYTNDSRYYKGIVAGKTGYTSLAGNTLATCVEKDGTRLIAVVMKAKSTHYEDTKALLDYGYEVLNAGTGQGSSVGQTVSQYKWIQDGNDWRLELADGKRAANCLLNINNVSYLFGADGRMLTGWQNVSGTWRHFAANGAMTRNAWAQDGGEWFYLGADGTITKNAWEQDSGKWFYLGADGKITKNDWAQDAGKWFYLGADGTMMKNTWIDNKYYVGADGIWVESATP
ncbi:MAG: D-alanyl-D-alanine carboxypeptidase [Lachnospiraceae bacterium]|nr:D-alanyl-D-alanine carboxypeptidase [Lachnospiraceae bacterium]